jgi:hypothetical protein
MDGQTDERKDGWMDRETSYLIFMTLYTVVIHYLQMCMKEYGCCPKFGRGDNLTYTLKYVLYGETSL